MSEALEFAEAYLLEQKKNEKLLDFIVEFEIELTELVKRNEVLSGTSEYQDGITLGLRTARSMFLVQVWKEIIRLYTEKK